VNGDGDGIDGGRRTSIDFYAQEALEAIPEGLGFGLVTQQIPREDGVREGRKASSAAETDRGEHGAHYPKTIPPADALAAAAIYGSPINLHGAGRQIFGGREQNAAPVDAAAIRKLTYQISGHVISPEAPDYESSRLSPA
jgi:hypothetical protein